MSHAPPLANQILNGSLDLKCISRTLLLEQLEEAIDYQRSMCRSVLSYRFGFARLPFQDSRLQDGFAAHFWSNQIERNDCPHTHIFDLRSRILFGEVTNKIWTVVASGEKPYAQVQPSYVDKGASKPIENATQIFLDASSSQTYSDIEGSDYYEMKKGVIHSTELAGEAITLMHRMNTESNLLPTNFIPVDRKENVPPEDLGESGWKIIDQMWRRLRSGRLS